LVYDLLILNGHILDGTGNPWFRADVGIVDDGIEVIGKLAKEKADRKMNVEGQVVAPGFIDIHSHSDMPLLVDPRAESKIHQGVTTEVVGNCGSSAAPMNKAVKAYREKYSRNAVGDDFQFDWQTMADYLARLDRQGVAVNVAPHVGHGTIRHNVMGYEAREPTDSELGKMRRLVDAAMRDGAWGISSGLIYPPSVYAKTDELVELAKVSAKHGGLYASHIRGEGETLLDAVREAVEIGERSGAPVQIAHFKASGKEFWGRTKESHRLVEEARARGVDVTFDQYPYIASSTGLSSVLPHWAHEGGAEKMMERLRDPEIRKRLESERRSDRDWSEIMVVYVKNNPKYIGKRITEIAEMEGKKPADAAYDLLLAEDTQVQTVMFGLGEDDVRYVMRSPYMMVGSDGSAVSPKGILGRGQPHPRYYGTFPRVLGHYARDEGIITLQEAVRKMTSAPAQKMGFKDRGLLREGYKADITVFDPSKVKDEATFTDPHRFASGIPYVLVNGTVVISKGKQTSALPGKTLRKSQ
jgi:N-acyl-D-amino-acid deacylase